MVTVLADIGGTHARFAIFENGGIKKTEKLEASRFQSLEGALAHYCARVKENAGGTLYVATAAWPHADGTWQFARPGRWAITEKAIQEAGWELAHIGNDFAASALGAVRTDAGTLRTVQKAGSNPIPQHTAAVLGSGTGLGLAYVDGCAPRATYGGHMNIPCRTEEHHDMVARAQAFRGGSRPVSAEDILSGPGLSLLHQAVCAEKGVAAEYKNAEDLLKSGDEVFLTDTLRLYHEILGFFSHQAVLFGQAYRALYLDGGVIHRLSDAGLFDSASFLEFFIDDPIALIKKQLEAMPVHIVNDPFIALRGLAEMAKDGA